MLWDFCCIHAGSLHASIKEGDIARMVELNALTIPVGKRLNLEEGVYHLTFTDVYAPFVAGDVVPVTITFEKARKVELKLSVRPLGGAVEHQH